MQALKRQAHREIPEVARNAAADGQNDDVGEMVLAAPPQHCADPEDRESDGAQFQPLGLIHDSAPTAKRWMPSWTPSVRRTLRRITPRRNRAAMKP